MVQAICHIFILKVRLHEPMMKDSVRELCRGDGGQLARADLIWN